MILTSTKKLLVIIICFLLMGTQAMAQDNYVIKVQFIYGSKPLKEHRSTEKKWFGGLAGGHVGIETDSNMVLDFHHYKGFHVFATNTNKSSRFRLRPACDFWSGFGCDGETVKKATVIIPITKEQKQRFDSITNSYLSNSPYDYAFFGMRCAAATYDILSQLDLVERYSSRTMMYWKVFYPKLLRQRLYNKAKENGWAVIKQEGSTKRKWEKD